MPLVIINANLIDCIRPDPAPQSSVVVENGRIARVLRGGSPTVGPGGPGRSKSYPLPLNPLC